MVDESEQNTYRWRLAMYGRQVFRSSAFHSPDSVSTTPDLDVSVDHSFRPFGPVAGRHSLLPLLCIFFLVFQETGLT